MSLGITRLHGAVLAASPSLRHAPSNDFQAPALIAPDTLIDINDKGTAG